WSTHCGCFVRCRNCFRDHGDAKLWSIINCSGVGQSCDAILRPLHHYLCYVWHAPYSCLGSASLFSVGLINGVGSTLVFTIFGLVSVTVSTHPLSASLTALFGRPVIGGLANLATRCGRKW